MTARCEHRTELRRRSASWSDIIHCCVAWMLLAHVAPALACVGDCQRDCQVTIDELLTIVDISLGTADLSACAAGDGNGDQTIAIDELVTAVNDALDGCAATCVSRTPVPSAAATPAATPTTCPDMTGMWSGSISGDNLATWTADLTQDGTAVIGQGTLTFPFLGKCSNSNKFCTTTVPCTNADICVIPYQPSTDVFGTNVCGVVDLGFRDVIGFIGEVSGDVASGTYTDPDFGVGNWRGTRQPP
jgi:hypothetical protein